MESFLKIIVVFFLCAGHCIAGEWSLFGKEKPAVAEMSNAEKAETLIRLYDANNHVGINGSVWSHMEHHGVPADVYKSLSAEENLQLHSVIHNHGDKWNVAILEIEPHKSEESADRRLIHFYADWCGPCKTQDRVLRKSGLYELIEHVDTDDDPEITKKFKVSVIPCILYQEKVRGEWTTRNKLTGIWSADALVKKYPKLLKKE